jgi:hypothetical protein
MHQLITTTHSTCTGACIYVHVCQFIYLVNASRTIPYTHCNIAIALSDLLSIFIHTYTHQAHP